MKNLITLKILLTCILLSPLCGNAGIEYKQVETVGFGRNENEAIQDGLIQALGQVKGTYIEADTIRQVKRLLQDNKQIVGDTATRNATLRSTKDTKSKISSFTKGLISSYEVVNSSKNTDMGHEVRLRVTIPDYNAGVQINRLRLAILPFRDLSQPQHPYGKRFLDGWSKELEEGLVQSRRFAVLDRNYQQESKSELETYIEGHRSEEIAKLGQRIGTDYIISGSLMSFQDKKDNADSNFPEIKRNKISLRIIDVTTGQIKYARNVSSAKIAVQQILDAIYPISVVSIQDRQVTLGMGGDGVKLGEVYELIALGKQIYDPYTKESLGFDETSIGFVKVTKVNAKTSIAELSDESGQAKLSQKGRYILRSAISQASLGGNSKGSEGESADW